jgi:hypothetical protein
MNMNGNDLKDTFDLIKKNFKFIENKSFKITGTISPIKDLDDKKTSLFGIDVEHNGNDEQYKCFDFSILISEQKNDKILISINVNDCDKKSVIKIDDMLCDLELGRNESEIIIFFKQCSMITINLTFDESLVIDWSYAISECDHSTYLHFCDDLSTERYLQTIDHDNCINHGNDHYVCKIYEISSAKINSQSR